MIRHVEALARAGDEEEIARLERVSSPPEGTGPIWGVFADLHRCRGSTGMGPAAIGYRDIQAWMVVTGDRLEAWELRAVLTADRAFMAFAAKQQAEDGK